MRKRYLETARDCLMEAERTLDPETAAALRKLAERFRREAERHAAAHTELRAEPYGSRDRGEWLDDGPGGASVRSRSNRAF